MTQSTTLLLDVIPSSKMKVEIISRELIKPSNPTPPALKIYNFSFIDQISVPLYVPLLLYYEATTNMTQSSAISSHLKSSLSDTLNHFYPLAGRTTGDQSYLDCSDQGVYYAESRVSSPLSDILKNPNFKELSEFAPFKLTGVEAKEVEEQLGVQVNYLQCGGIVIGVCVSHKIADGISISGFVKAWSDMARGDGASFVGPVFNSATIFPPTDLEEYCPKPRKLASQPIITERLINKRFVFTASVIAALKAKVIASSAGVVNPTRVEVLSALIWKCGQAVKGDGKLKSSIAFHVVDIRRRMVPPLEKNSFGNLFQMVCTSAVTDDDAADLGCLVKKLRGCIGEIDGEYVKELVGENSLGVLNGNLRHMGNLIRKGEAEIFNFSSWCGFPVYEADFGWGKPSWVSIVEFVRRNSVFLFDSATGGGIEVWFTLSEDDMIEFEKQLELQLLSISTTSFKVK